MADLRQQLDELRRALDALPSSATASEIAQLESEARLLLAQSKNTQYEEEARELFAELARHSAPPSPEAATVRGLLRRARIRIEIAGDEDDIDEAVDILARALDHDPDNPETLELLQQAADRSPHLSLKVRGLLERYGVETASPSERDDQETAPSSEAPTLADISSSPDELFTSEAPTAAPAEMSGTLSQLLSDVTQAYYSGDYQRTVEFASRILAEDPNNTQAQDYRQKAEENLLRGVVPDHRIPFEARIAYNRANSLVRAGNYDEAERLYREARDLATRAGITSWKDVEQALLDIQDLALARELLAEGDRLLAADDWDSALQKYEGAMRVVPNDPLAQERIDLVYNVRQQFDQAAVQLNMTSGSLRERALELQSLHNTLATLRQLLPSSERLRQLSREIESRIDSIIVQLYNQAQAALTRTDSITVLEERLRLTSEAVRALETASELAPTDEDVNSLLQRARQGEGDMAEARHIIERASALIAQNYENELGQARTMLSGLREYAQDPRYRMVVSDLLVRHLERVESALDQGDTQTAQRWLDVAKDEPFRILGRRTEILRLEESVRQMRRQRYVVWGVSGIVILIVLAAVGFATKDPLKDALDPILHLSSKTPTPTFTATFTPSITPTGTSTSTPTPTDTPTDTPTYTPTSTPTDTPTPTATDTPTSTLTLTPSITPTPTFTWTPSWTWTPSDTPSHTWTPTPSDTPTHTHTPTHTYTPSPTPSITLTPSQTLTPSITPTPIVLCLVLADREAVNVRAQPGPSRERIYTVRIGQPMEVLERDFGDDKAVWYRVKFQIEDSEITGWVRADLVNDIQNACPPLTP